MTTYQNTAKLWDNNPHVKNCSWEEHTKLADDGPRGRSIKPIHCQGAILAFTIIASGERFIQVAAGHPMQVFPFP
jgi:hypothetical protein